jgi:hypothetical protein
VPRPGARCAGRPNGLGACLRFRPCCSPRASPGGVSRSAYWRKRNAAHRGLKRVVWIAGGVLVLVLGLFFSVLPGPGILFLLAGFAMLAQESLATARALDRLELAGRRLLQRIHGG